MKKKNKIKYFSDKQSFSVYLIFILKLLLANSLPATINYICHTLK